MALRRLIPVLLLTAVTAAADDLPPLEDVVDVYYQTTIRFIELGLPVEEMVRRDAAATGTYERGEPLDPKTATAKIADNAKRLEETRDYFDGAKPKVIGSTNRASWMNSLSYFLWSAAGNMQAIQFEETYRTTWLIQIRQRRASWQLFQEYEGIVAGLKKEYAGRDREFDAAQKNLREDYVRREQEIVKHALAEHAAATRRLLDRRRAICGILWSVEAYHREAGDLEWADVYRKKIYGAWATDLGKMSPDSYLSGGGLDSAVITSSNANTIDWLQLRLYFITGFETSWQMDNAMRSESVEDYRQAPAVPTSQRVDFDWIVTDNLGGERVSETAPIGASVRLRMRTLNPLGPDRREAKVQIVHAAGATEERKVFVYKNAAGLNLESRPLQLVAGTPQTEQSVRVLGGDRLEAVQGRARGVLAIVAPPTQVRFVAKRLDGTFAPADLPLVFGTEFYVEVSVGAPQAGTTLTVDVSWTAGQSEPITVHVTPEDPLVFRSRPIRLLPPPRKTP